MAGTLTASIIKNDTTSPPAFQNSAGTEIGTLCRAWVQFNGNDGTRRGSFNVSSVTRTGVGAYTVNYTNAFSDANYSGLCWASSDAVATTFSYLSGTNTAATTTTMAVQVVNGSSGAADRSWVSVAVFR